MVELFSSPRSHGQLAAIRARVEKLEEDQAIFVAISATMSNDEVRFEVLSLRRNLRTGLVGLPIAALEDFDKSRVWIYKLARIPGAAEALVP